MRRFFLACALGTLVLACHSTSDAKASEHPSVDRQPLEAKPARVTIVNTAGESVQVDVELALTNEQREQGLMNRPQLAAGKGMLFVFPQEKNQTFWMKNTLIALDMIFIRADHTILGITADAEPLTLTPRGVEGQSLYVLEVPGGYSAAHRLAAGDRVKMDNVPAAAH